MNLGEMNFADYSQQNLISYGLVRRATFCGYFKQQSGRKRDRCALFYHALFYYVIVRFFLANLFHCRVYMYCVQTRS